jgi:MFS family permease
MNSSWAALRHPIFRSLLDYQRNFQHLRSGSEQRHGPSDECGGMSIVFDLVNPGYGCTPFFFFTIPAGFLADHVNRKKLLCAINLWLAAGAFGLVVFGWLKVLSPSLILFCVFFIGAGFAFNAPLSTAVVAQLVPETELASVVTLNGLQFNISGIVGSVLGGLLIPVIGVNLIFTANAARFCSLFLCFDDGSNQSNGQQIGPSSPGHSSVR